MYKRSVLPLEIASLYNSMRSLERAGRSSSDIKQYGHTNTDVHRLKRCL